jgi:hypothetical protein
MIMKLIAIAVITALAYILYRRSKNSTEQTEEVSVEKPIATMKATPKKKKDPTPKLEDSTATKPKRKYNKKPKA